jgi:hypothetical protein
MGYDALIRSGISAAATVTASLQANVLHEAWTGIDAYGEPTYAAGIQRKAIVLRDAIMKRDRGGEWVQTQAEILFLKPFVSNGAPGRNGPIDIRDRITLPDGFTCPIVETEGLFDPSTSAPYFAEVWLGYRHR